MTKVEDKIINCPGRRIPLTGLSNTRDLGGYQTADKRTILPKKLLRSGTLFNATEEDLRILTEEYKLGTIVDFRTEVERKQKPDPEIAGVVNIFNPILDEETVGVTFEEKEGEDKDENDAIASIFNHASDLGGKPTSYLDQVYESLVTNDYAVKGYGRFFDHLLEADDRAVLWHCSAGKDRVGIGTALLLTALGVDRETVIADYMKTNDNVAEDAKEVAAAVLEKYGDAKLAECVSALLTVEKEYILHAFAAMEKRAGSVEAYISEVIGVTPKKQELLKKRFLTETV